MLVFLGFVLQQREIIPITKSPEGQSTTEN